MTSQEEIMRVAMLISEGVMRDELSSEIAENIFTALRQLGYSRREEVIEECAKVVDEWTGDELKWRGLALEAKDFDQALLRGELAGQASGIASALRAKSNPTAE